MGAPLSQDLRDRLGAAFVEGSSARAAAKRFGISESSAIRWKQRWKSDGHANARPTGGDHRSRLKEHRNDVLIIVGTEPDLTLKEIRAELVKRCGIKVGLTRVWRVLHAHRMTVKKKPSCG